MINPRRRQPRSMPHQPAPLAPRRAPESSPDDSAADLSMPPPPLNLRLLPIVLFLRRDCPDSTLRRRPPTTPCQAPRAPRAHTSSPSTPSSVTARLRPTLVPTDELRNSTDHLLLVATTTTSPPARPKTTSPPELVPSSSPHRTSTPPAGATPTTPPRAPTATLVLTTTSDDTACLAPLSDNCCSRPLELTSASSSSLRRATDPYSDPPSLWLSPSSSLIVTACRAIRRPQSPTTQPSYPKSQPNNVDMFDGIPEAISSCL